MNSVDAAEMRAAAEGYEAALGVVAAPRTGVARAADFFELTKPRITTFVLLSAATGFFLGLQAGVPLVIFLHLMIGVALVAAGTNGFNHLLEGDVDRRMDRTRRRPIPTGRVSPREAGIFSALTGVAGIGYLALMVNPLTAALALIALVSLAVFAGLGSFTLYHRLFTGLAIPGWTSIMMTASFFGALNALGIAILGEYVLRIYDQVRARPLFLVDRRTNFPAEES